MRSEISEPVPAPLIPGWSGGPWLCKSRTRTPANCWFAPTKTRFARLALSRLLDYALRAGAARLQYTCNKPPGKGGRPLHNPSPECCCGGTLLHVGAGNLFDRGI